jgi:hypothetical protein
MPVRSEISDRILKSEIKKAAQKAIRENRALGITTTALVKGNIVEISPDKTIKIIKRLNLNARKLTKRNFTLG